MSPQHYRHILLSADPLTPAMVLQQIEQTGMDLIKQVGIAHAVHSQIIPRRVLSDVLQSTGMLLAMLLAYVQTIEDQRSDEQ